MFKRRVTLDKIQKVKIDLQSEYLFQLDKCQQIPNDDKLKIRKHIKQNTNQINYIFQLLRKERNYTQFQIRLRKYLQSSKQQQKRNPNKHQQERKNKDNHKTSSQTSHQGQDKTINICHNDKQRLKRKIITIDINQLRKNIQQHPKSRFNLTPTNQSKDLIDTWKEKINTSPNYSFGEIKLNDKQNLNPNQTDEIELFKSKSSKRLLKGQADPTRSTFRLKQHRLSSQQSRNCNEIDINKNKRQSIIAYPSNIKHLLASKLKSQKIMQRKDMQECQTIKMAFDKTVEKKLSKFKFPDENNSTLNFCDKSISRNPIMNQQTVTQKAFKNKKKSLPQNKLINQINLDQNASNQQQEKEIHGKFYIKIKNIIEDHNF